MSIDQFKKHIRFKNEPSGGNSFNIVARFELTINHFYNRKLVTEKEIEEVLKPMLVKRLYELIQ